MTRASLALRSLLLAFLAAAPGQAFPAGGRTAASFTAAGGAGAAGGASGVVVDDLYALGWMSDLAVAPDGKSAVYAWTRAERSVDSYISRLFRLDLDKNPGDSRPFAPAPAAGVDATQPRFSPDGRFLAWVESADESVSLRVAPAAGGRALAKIALDDVPGSFAWSPDGEQLVIERLDAAPAGTTDDSPWVVTRSLARRDGEGFLDGRHVHLWIVGRRGDKSLQITFGPWDDSAPAWSPDGARIAFVSNRSADPDATDNSDIFLVPAGGGATTPLVQLPGPESAPAWSHGGDRLAFHSVRRADDYYQPQRLMTVEVTANGAAGQPQDLTGALDSWIASDCMPEGSAPPAPLWTADDSSILAVLEHRGGTRVVQIAARDPGDKVPAAPRY